MSRFDELMVAIGRRLRAVREAKALNMKLAHALREEYGVKVDPSYLSRMERGKVEIPLRTLYALSQFYDIPLGTLIDPDVLGNAAGVEFIFHDRALVEDLLFLRELIGEDALREQLRACTRQIQTLISRMPASAQEYLAAGGNDSPDPERVRQILRRLEKSTRVTRATWVNPPAPNEDES